jgi:phosphinothricin acetyltransferase
VLCLCNWFKLRPAYRFSAEDSICVAQKAHGKGIGAHRATGISQVGAIKSCGWKFDRWPDIVLMEKPLGAGDTTPAA